MQNKLKHCCINYVSKEHTMKSQSYLKNQLASGFKKGATSSKELLVDAKKQEHLRTDFFSYLNKLRNYFTSCSIQIQNQGPSDSQQLHKNSLLKTGKNCLSLPFLVMMQRCAKRTWILLTIVMKESPICIICKSLTFWCKIESRWKNSHAKNSSAAVAIGWWSLCCCWWTFHILSIALFYFCRSRKNFPFERGASDYANQLIKKLLHLRIVITVIA